VKVTPDVQSCLAAVLLSKVISYTITLCLISIYLLILHLSAAICEIWPLYFTYSVYLVLSLKPSVTALLATCRLAGSYHSLTRYWDLEWFSNRATLVQNETIKSTQAEPRESDNSSVNFDFWGPHAITKIFLFPLCGQRLFHVLFLVRPISPCLIPPNNILRSLVWNHLQGI
jgi:hypothetical protein